MLTIHRLAEADVTQTVNTNIVDSDTITQAITCYLSLNQKHLLF